MLKNWGLNAYGTVKGDRREVTSIVIHHQKRETSKKGWG